MIVKLYRADVCRAMGWAGEPSLDNATWRTRQGTARVPFPDPDGYDLERPRCPPWWSEEAIHRYRRRCRAAGILRPMPADVQAMFAMRDDGLPLEQIAVTCGWSKSTVGRHLNKPRPPTTTKK